MNATIKNMSVIQDNKRMQKSEKKNSIKVVKL